MQAAFDAIAQPTRREILRILARGELSAGEIASSFEITQPAVSQHLKTLHDAGLVTRRAEGTRRLYSVRTEGLADLEGFLADVLPPRLERLKHLAEAEERGRSDAARN
jgi:DNA-binding transcriptional ArsR family regulator